MQLKALGDPQRMRPSTRRTDFGYADPIGEHRLADGRVARVTWLEINQTHVHVVVWVPGSPDFATVEHVARFNAAVESEKLLRELES